MSYIYQIYPHHTISNIEWIEYEDIVPLDEEGYYIIYVKAVDSDKNVKYINSEQLIIDLTAPTAKITMNENTWNSFKDDLNNIVSMLLEDN